MNELPNGLILLQVNPDVAAEMRPQHRAFKWLYVKGPDEQWVTLRKMSDAEYDQAWDQKVDGFVQQGTKVRFA